MPKLKSHSGAKKRFKFSARGKAIHKRAGARHLLQGMSAKRSRFLRRPGKVNAKQTEMLKRLLPYG